MDSLPGLDSLSLLGLRAGVDMRPTLLRVLTDLYVQKLAHTADEERHYTELALRLLDAVDVPTRTAVARRLARHLAPPLQVMERLAADLPDVAAAVRAHPVLQRRGEAAEPAPPAPPVTETVEAEVRPEADVRLAPGEEGTPSAAAPTAVDAATASELNELFFAASADERRLILLNLDIAAPGPAAPIDFARDSSVGQRLEKAALGRNREDFAQHLAQALQIPRSQARRIASDELGESIVVVAKALKIPRDVVYRILLFVNTTVGHSVERVHTLAMLYDEMTTQTAEHMVVIWQALQPTERAAAQHRPLLWHDEARARARTATEAVRRAPSTQRRSERRDVS